MTDMETRFFRASVRRQRSQGAFTTQTIACTIPVTGSHHDMMAAAITDMNKQGYEVNHIISHSIKRDCV